jgi:ABC-2 type transport system ATP-binding protein
MIDVTDLSKSYGTVEALKEVSFHVDAGEIIGLLGPNGAGKTTMMKILTGYLQPGSGTAVVDGLDVLTESLEVQKRIGYLPETAPLYPELSVQAYLSMIASLRGVPEEDRPALMSEAIRATGLEDHLTRPIGQLSKGFRQRVGLAQAIVHKPKLLILDEPTIGLDPTQIVEVRRLVHRLAQNSTILLSTHILSEVEAICSRVIILLNGEIKADARLDELAATTDVILVLGNGAPDVTQDLQAMEDVSTVQSTVRGDERTYRVRAANRKDLRPGIYALASKEGWPLRELRRDVRTLETVFNELATAESSGVAEEGEGENSEPRGGEE